MSPPRNTRTGSVLEQMILPALQQGGYTYETQVRLALRMTGKRHILDVPARDTAGKESPISLKWQRVSGTAEEKVPYEALSLAEAIRTSNGVFDKAYLVLGGSGWSLREFYVGGGLNDHLQHGNLVEIIGFESFVARANGGKL